ncbi:MAG TPA: response regulator [Verrucomicrobiota bacterium]|nr:response regulator [Verrucomicrobiota bacterium]HNU50567.1 response regulator [Verrucomicrobiota bacterium]
MPPKTSMTPLRVLVVDDDPTAAIELSRVLRPVTPGGIEFDVDTVRSAAEALPQVQAAARFERPFSLAFVALNRAQGWDPVAVARQLAAPDLELQVLLGSDALDEPSRTDLLALGEAGNLLLIETPPDAMRVRLLAQALAEKARLHREVRRLAASAPAPTAARQQQERLEAMGHFAAFLSHDMNNLLTVIQGRASLALNHQPPDSPGHRAVAAILKAAERASNLTRNLLLFSGNQVLKRRPVRFQDLLRSVEKATQGTSPDNIDLRVTSPLVLPSIQGDPVLLHQLLTCLITNAREAMPDGGQLVLTAEAVDLDEAALRPWPDRRPGRYLRVRLLDTGRGIRAQDLPFVFDPFYTTKDVGHGSGFGLALAYGIMKLHRGWIDLESTIGKGTQIMICFPVADQDPAPEPAAPVAVPESATPQATILVVDDDPAVSAFLSEVLRSHGYTVLTAATGEEAMTLAAQRSEPLDLLLTDMVMPGGMTGADVARHLVGRNPKLRVIFTSGYLSAGNSPQTASLQGFSFLPKPYEPDYLLQTVGAALAPKSQPGAPQPPATPEPTPPTTPAAPGTQPVR